MTRPPDSALTYAAAGVDATEAERGLGALAEWIRATFDFHSARPLLPLGYFANVLPLTPELALAISTDGVGTKILVAQQVGRFDTVGIDCVAMNANDILCVGGRPLAMVDYLAVEEAEPAFLAEIGRGLYAGAKEAGISIPGGELAQVREMLHGSRSGRAFDLVGTCVGTLAPSRLLVGADIEPGDVVVGLASSGIHSNGLTLARRVLLDRAGLDLAGHVPDLGRTLAEELLEPTRIYVRPALAMLDAGLAVKAFAHITGDGLLNLARVVAPMGFVIDLLPECPPIFALIQARGGIPDEEMFGVFNMGVGFCAVVATKDVDAVRATAEAHGCRSLVLGRAVADPQRRIWIPGRRLLGGGKAFHVSDDRPPKA